MFKSSSKLPIRPQREEGQGLVEYALILVLVSVVVIVVLSLVGPGVGNIFSEVVTVLNGGATGDVAAAANDTEDNITETCVDTVFGYHALVPSDGKLPQGTAQYAVADDTCTGASAGAFGRDSVYTGLGGTVAEADALCQTHYGRNSTQQIWIGTSDAFWYCS